MTEQEFWHFLGNLWEKGRVVVKVGIIDQAGPEMQRVGEYLNGHALLPEGHDKLPVGDILKIGELLFQKEVSRQAKEAAMIILAHYPREEALTILARYALSPDKGLECFAEIALDECAMWNE